MAKSKELDKPKNSEIANAQPMPWKFEGGDESDRILPILVYYQDKKQREKLGEHNEGDLVDSSTQECVVPVKESRKFAPVFGWKEYIEWDPDNRGRILSRFKNVEDVRPGGLDWTKDEKGKDVRPAFTIHRNFMVIFEGAELPSVLSLTNRNKMRTKAAQLINTMMDRRARMKKGPAFFSIEAVTVSNSEGEWFEPKVAFVGACDDATAEAVKEWGQFAAESGIDTNIEQADSHEDAPY